ncbi:F0F1 ATP synthase subunit epsilon [Jiella sp. MQZ9-1]|uniref:ATP synthase epsilon chain n=1 Tax=Jiella flava TaxID=2816857 RepID=A0A939JT11_9HYPH|nr:F0F1 ATP synthase subunit epsilon [Jiella flava]MBO0661655.1 F0F1 ATP synthase subunit epsilon [Jiella flava]MCD2470297.1 F0F1 ATP synthase subunit epsilon [Jiella flava]
MADSFQFELVSPEKLLMSEAVTAVSVPGSEGFFTVMAKHAPVMTTVKPGIVLVTTESGEEQRIFVQGGFADVNEIGLTLLAEHASPADEVDLQALDQSIRDAEEDVADATSPEAKAHAQHKLDQLKEAREGLSAA